MRIDWLVCRAPERSTTSAVRSGVAAGADNLVRARSHRPSVAVLGLKPPYFSLATLSWSRYDNPRRQTTRRMKYLGDGGVGWTRHWGDVPVFVGARLSPLAVTV